VYYLTDSQKWEKATPSNHYVSLSRAFSCSLLPILYKVVLLLTFFSGTSAGLVEVYQKWRLQGNTRIGNGETASTASNPAILRTS